MLVMPEEGFKFKNEWVNDIVVMVGGTNWAEFIQFVNDTKDYRHISKPVIREDPIFKKKGNDYLRVSRKGEGYDFLRMIQEPPFNVVVASPKVLQLAAYQLKISRMKSRGEWTPEVRDYMTKGERHRIVEMLKAGEWLTTSMVSKEASNNVEAWQREVRRVNLGRQNGLRYEPIEQIGNYRKKNRILVEETPKQQLTKEELFERSKITNSFQEFLETYPLDFLKVSKWKEQNGYLSPEEAKMFSKEASAGNLTNLF